MLLTNAFYGMVLFFTLLLSQIGPVPDNGNGGAVSSVFTRTGSITAASGDYTVAQVTGAAPIASPAFTGTPAAPTPASGTKTTQLATMQAVDNEAPTQFGGCVGTFASSMTSGTLQSMGAGSSGACSGTLTGNGNVMTRAGVLRNLSVRCITPGVNTSSGVFTLLDAPPGTAFASATNTGITVTFGTHTANSVQSDTTHSFGYNAGDMIFLIITTQPSETLTTCSASYNF